MTHLPVVSSILSAPHLVPLFQVQYDLSNETTCRLLKAGVNHTYLVTDGDRRFVFRVYCIHWRTQTDIAEEIRLLLLLKEHGLPVSYPITDYDGVFMQVLQAPEGVRYGVLFSFAAGEKLLQFPVEMHRKMGGILAKIHQVTVNRTLERVRYTPEVMVVDPFEKLKQHIAVDTPEMQWMLKAQQYLLRLYDGIDHSKVRHGIVHMDIWFDNFAIQGDEVTIYDFDFCGNGMLAYDLAYYILQTYNTERENLEVCKEKVAAFLEGYRAVTPLSAEEQALLPALGVSMHFFYLGVQSQRYEDWSNTFFNEVYLKRYIMLLIKRFADLHGLEI
jgi:Ser/Thr protein kinase RdoA (MazF antagonist)